MSLGEITTTVIGNLTDDPELRFTPSGVAVAKFRVASTPRVYDKASNQWKDGNASFMPVTVWRQLAENVAESLKRGDRVIVHGAIRQEHYETREGEKRTAWVMVAEDVACSMKFAQVQVKKLAREGAKPDSSVPDPWATDGLPDTPPF
jgi:single-strand DNA-binding protein